MKQFSVIFDFYENGGDDLAGAVSYPIEMKRAIFGPPFPGPSSTLRWAVRTLSRAAQSHRPLLSSLPTTIESAPPYV